MDDAEDLAEFSGYPNEIMNRSARGDVDRRGADVETSIEKNLCRRVHVFLAYIGQQDLLACADRRKIAWPIEPAPITTITSAIFCLSMITTPDGRLTPGRAGRPLPVAARHREAG